MKNRYKVKSLKPHKLGYYSIDGARVFPVILNMDNSNIFTTDIVFKQYDYGTCTINAQIVKKDDTPVDITNVSIISIFKIANKTIVESVSGKNYVKVVDKSSGIIKISIPNAVLKHVGQVECEIVLFDETNNRTTSPRFLFKINESIYNHEDSNVDIPQDENYPLLVTMLNEIKTLKSEMAEFLNILQSTNSEVESNETVRQSQESLRQEQETQRQESLNSAVKSIDNKIAEIEQAKGTMVNTVNDKLSKVDAKVLEIEQAKNTMVSTVNTELSKVETKVTAMEQTKDTMVSKVAEMEQAKNTMVAKVTEMEQAKNDMITKVGEMEQAKNNMVDRVAVVEQAKDTMVAKVEVVEQAKDTMVAKVAEMEQIKDTMITTVDDKLAKVDAKVVELVKAKDTMVSTVNTELSKVQTRVDKIVASGTVDLEVKDSRFGQDGVEYSCLKERLISIENTPQVIIETIEG